MKKKRIIPVLLLKNGWLVQSKDFKRHQNLGNPVTAVKRLSEWASDEIIYLDISQNDKYDLRRDDLGNPNKRSFLEIIEEVSKVTFMPMTVGGRIRNVDDMKKRFEAGADKISINTSALENREIILKAANQFGSQAVVISIDVKIIDGEYKVFSKGGSLDTGIKVIDWVKEVEERGAGEILLNSIDRDGAKTGYDLELLSQVSENVKIPVIALGGVGEWEHFAEAMNKTKVDAVAAANIFNYTDQSVFFAKKYLFERGYNVRPPETFSL